MVLRDNFWLWGHPEGRYNNEWGNTQKSRMTPMEACLYLGIRNTFMVPVEWEVNRRQYNKSFITLDQVGWEFGGASIATGGDTSAIDSFLDDARDFPNIKCTVFDDFKSHNRYKNVPLENLIKIHDKFHNNDVRRLDTWMVLYTMQFGLNEQEDQDFKPYLDSFDGVIMWTWHERDVHLIPEKFEILKKLSPNTRKMFGCYLWNFGEQKEATAEAVLYQLDWYRERILSGEAEGVVMHTNTMADLDLPAYDAAFEWMAKHGDEIIG